MIEFELLSRRILIIGNSGSGKSALGERLAALVNIPVYDLDLLHWDGNGYGQKRDEDVARRMVLELTSRAGWIVEGVFGWLAEVALPTATALIWLDFPWSLCRTGILARGRCRGATEQDTLDLLKWAENYWIRQTSSSFAGHAAIFNHFAGTKFRLHDRGEVDELLDNLRRNREC
jgi:adenylate kinase family enzyme